MKEVALAIREGLALFAAIYKDSNNRKVRACKETAEKYMQVNERNGEFKKITDDRREKLLKHYRKRFFAYN